MAGHRRSEDEAALCARLLVQLAEMLARDFREVGGAFEIDVHDVVEVLVVLLVDELALRPRDSCIRNDNIDFTEILNLLREGRGNLLFIRNVRLVGLALDAVLFGQRLCLLSRVVRIVPDSNVGAGLRERLGNGVADSTGAASDGSDLAVELEEIEHGKRRVLGVSRRLCRIFNVREILRH